MPAPTLERLLLLALSVPDYRRRLVGRLRPAVTGWHYPRFRMTRRSWQVIRPGRQLLHS
jgi:hypothetical protein